MVAGEAREALAVVQPYRVFVLVHSHVAHGAVTRAESAADAAVGVNAERRVFDNPAYEHIADESAVDARPVAHENVAHAVASLAYVFDEA